MSYQDYGCISVLMSVYNGAATLEKAIDSVLNQTYRDLEFIICDDASTDETWGILQRYEKLDKRVLCFQNRENIGLGASLNRCLEKSSGKYIARQDADDISDPDRLEKTISFLVSGPAPYVGCGVRVFDELPSVSAGGHKAHDRPKEPVFSSYDDVPPLRIGAGKRIQRGERNAPNGRL